MSVNEVLVSIVVLLGAAATWRLLRWRYRPALEIDPDLRRASGTLLLEVRNTGAATARRCRGRLLRADREVEADWSRIEPDPGRFPFAWTDGARERDLRRDESASLVVARTAGLAPGRYRLEVAVIDGEERRARLEFAWPALEEEREER